jgi:hypothetical protein
MRRAIMLLECQSCQKKLNIADDKIPFGRPFTFTCPSCKCKNNMTLPERRIAEISLDGDEPTSPIRREDGRRPEPAASTQHHQPVPNFNPLEFAPGALEVLPEGLKSALVAFDSEETQDKLQEKLSAMGFRPTIAVNVRDAVKQLKFGRFQLMIIQEDYYGATLSSNQLLRAVNSLELNVRRDMFIVVIGPSFTTLDDLTAFSLSLDTVINVNDLDDIDRILISAMGHATKFIAAFKEMRHQRGLEYDPTK